MGHFHRALLERFWIGVLNRFGEPLSNTAPQNGDCHEFPAPFAGNSLAVPALPNAICPRSARFPKTVKDSWRDDVAQGPNGPLPARQSTEALAGVYKISTSIE